MNIPKRIAGAVIHALQGGVVPRIGLQYIAVGREKEIELQGIRLARITNGELKSESGRELLRRTLCSRLGRSVQAVSATTEWARRRLAMTLLAPHATMV